MMKKFIALFASVVVFGSAFAQTPTASTPATTASAPSTASATVVCKDDKQSTASATGNGVRAIASCNPQVVKKPTPKPAVKPALEVSTSAQDNAALVKALAEANVALRLSQSQQQQQSVGATRVVTLNKFPSVEQSQDGITYDDGRGNTYQRVTLGTRFCILRAPDGLGGHEVIKRIAVEGTEEETKKQCQLLSLSNGDNLKSVHPDGRNISTDVVVNVPLAPTSPAPNPVPQVSGKSHHTCEMTYNGKLAESFETSDEAECEKKKAEIARQRGWIRSPQQLPARPAV